MHAMNRVNISLGSSHTLIKDSNGSLWCMGNNNNGQLPIVNTLSVTDPYKAQIQKIKMAVCGSNHSLILDGDDNLWCFGNGINYQANCVKQPQYFQNLKNIQNLSAGWKHSAVIDGNNNLWTFGCNSNGQLGLDNLENCLYPTLVLDIEGAYQVSCGGKHTSVIDCYGHLWSFGDNYQGQLGIQDWEVHFKPTLVSDIPNALYVSCGWEHTAVIDSDYNLWVFGCNDDGQLGLNDEINPISQTTKPIKLLSNIKAVSCGGSHTIAIDFEGNVYAAGNNFEGQCGLPQPKNYRSFTKVPYLPKADIVECNQGTIIVDKNGKLWAFGANCFGELGPSISKITMEGTIELQPPQEIPIQVYIPYTPVKSARNVK